MDNKALLFRRPLGLMRKPLKLVLSVLVITLFFSCKEDKKQQAPQSTGDSLVDQITLQLQKAPNDTELLYQRANVLYEKDEFEPAIRDLEKAMSIDSLKPKFYHLLADNYLEYYKSRKALDIMETAVNRFPERILTHLKLSEMQLILNQNENSIMTINNILRMSPQNNEAYFMLGMNFRQMGDLNKAINSFQTAVEIEPEMIDAWIILGELHEKNGSDDPLKYYNNALLVDPDNAQVLHSKAFHLQNSGDIPGALEIYKQIGVKNPQYTDAYLNAGILYMEIDSFEQAFEQMKILAGIEPQNPLPYYYRGLIHKAYGNLEAAKIDLQNALNLAPTFPVAQEELDLVEAELVKTSSNNK